MLKVVDTKRPNVIVVITNATAKYRGHRVDLWRESVQTFAAKAVERVKLTLSVPCNYVLIENDLTYLKKYKDATYLPDSTIQPINLFEEMMRICEVNRDDLAYSTILHMFYESAKANGEVILGHTSPAIIVSEDRAQNPRQQQIKNHIDTFDSLPQTEIVIKLQEHAGEGKTALYSSQVSKYTIQHFLSHVMLHVRHGFKR